MGTALESVGDSSCNWHILLMCDRFLVEKAEQVKTASIISAEGDTEAADLLASAFAKAGEGLVSIQNFVVLSLTPWDQVPWSQDCGSSSFLCGSGSSFTLKCLSCLSGSASASSKWLESAPSIEPLRLHFKPLNLLNFYFHADPDTAFTLMRIRIRLPKIMWTMRGDPDPQPCL